MNIFILNNDPVLAAQEQCDKHVVKMIVESAQMLSTVHRMLDGTMERRPSKSGAMLQYWKLHDDREDIVYKACHFNHPSTVWTRESKANYDWHYKHFIGLCDEYTYRYGKVHSTDTKLRNHLVYSPNNIPMKGMTPFKLAMGSNPECMFEDAVKSYRAFYHTKQAKFNMAWTKRPQPKWFNAV
ncbi:MAG: hypothetical protein CBB70_00050 [Planctomycetaceae bacterium TMED10]|nr:MAG: hypothetical protein CBB70_00050 [Planctomycetaceae bacterium TMED10]|tara:strand:- start:1506 stop:2054 length:549 start_codon:yes stop_codon:yes gene_type:complete